MINIVPFKIEHFDQMELANRGWQRREDRLLFASYPSRGPAFTLMSEDNPVCAGGIVPLWPGVAEAWMLISKYVNQYPLSVYKSVSSVMLDIIEKMELFRVQTVIKEDDKTAIRWIERLGYTREGLLRQFGPDRQDYFIYGRVN
jgi:hypothetical protein